MLKIRLQRVGRKHEPAFRLVLTDSKNSTKSGKHLEVLGNYDARRGEKAAFKNDRITYWISKGAQASDTAHNLFVTHKIIEGKKINNLPKKSPIKKEGADAPAPAAPAPVPKTEVVAAEPVVETPAAEISPETAPEASVEAPSEPAPAADTVETPEATA